MEKKSSQVTLMMLIGIFIVMFAALVFYFAYYFENRNSVTLIFERSSIENYVNQCVKKTAEDGVKLLGRQGGFITSKDYMETPNTKISYLYDKENKVPSTVQMQDELAAYMDGNVGSCFKNFDDFKKQGWGIEQGIIHSKAMLNEKDVTFEVDFPLKVSSKGNTLNFEKFLVVLNVRLKYIHNLADYIVNFNVNNPKSIDRTALSNYDVDITVFPYRDSLVYDIKDSKSLIVNKPYRFMFALKFE